MPTIRRRPAPLRLEPLEDRTVPAKVAFAAGTLTLTPGPGDDLGVSALTLAGNNILPGRVRVTANDITIFTSGDDQRVDNLIVQGRDAGQFTLVVGGQAVL